MPGFFVFFRFVFISFAFPLASWHMWNVVQCAHISLLLKKLLNECKRLQILSVCYIGTAYLNAKMFRFLKFALSISLYICLLYAMMQCVWCAELLTCTKHSRQRTWMAADTEIVALSMHLPVTRFFIC